MTKSELLQYLVEMKDEIRNQQKFTGQAKMLRLLGKDIKWINDHRLTGNEPDLFYKKWNSEYGQGVAIKTIK
jgi:hypothetical protein